MGKWLLKQFVCVMSLEITALKLIISVAFFRQLPTQLVVVMILPHVQTLLLLSFFWPISWRYFRLGWVPKVNFWKLLEYNFLLASSCSYQPGKCIAHDNKVSNITQAHSYVSYLQQSKTWSILEQFLNNFDVTFVTSFEQRRRTVLWQRQS